MSRVVADRYAALVLAWLALRDGVSLVALVLAEALWELPHGTVLLVAHGLLAAALSFGAWGGRRRRAVVAFLALMTVGQPVWAFLVDPVSLQTFATLLQGIGLVFQGLAARAARRGGTR